MAQVIVGKKKIWRPIRLKQRRLESIIAELVFVRINKIGIGIHLQELDDVEERIRFEEVVVIEKSDPIPAGERKSLIRCRGNAFVFKACHNNTPVACSQK